jgi:hypothetical protein
MKKSFLMTLIMIIICQISFAQQPPNGGFELWEDAGTVVDEPVDWSSIKTSDGGDFINNAAPQVWERSDDAHTGSFSVRLENKAQFGIIANGTVTCGRIHVHPALDPDSSKSYTVIDDERWSEPFTYRPDSMVGWYKFWPQGDDSCQVRAVLHVGEGSIPAFETTGNWVGEAHWKSPSVTVTEWTRFSIPFEYFDDRTPEYLLMICNIEEANAATEGSIVLYDDIEFIYNNASIGEQDFLTDKIFVHNGVINLEKLPAELLDGSTFSLTSMSGQIVYEEPVLSNLIPYGGLQLKQGIYVATIITGEKALRTKLYLN